MANDDRYTIEQELMEAYALDKSWEEIGMPDIEAELQRVHRMASARSHGLRLRRIAAAAACLLVVVGAALTLTNSHSTDKDVCIAYVGGQRITDPSRIMLLLDNDIRNMTPEGDAETIESQLTDFFNE